MHTTLNLTGASLTGQKPAPTSRILLFTNGCPNLGDGSAVDRRAQQHRGKASADGEPGPDIVDPLKLARSIEFFDTLARSESATGMDVFCTGSSELAIAAYQAWVEPSGGYVLPHESFCPPSSSQGDLHALQHNVSFLLQHTHVSSMQHA